MQMLKSSTPYDRKAILDAAARARSRRRYRKAIALYRRVLAVEPRNVELHAKLAPLLAARGSHFDAWRSFRSCARAAELEKQPERAVAAYREAARCLPRQIEAWERLAEIELQRGRQKQALDALREGRRQFRRRGSRAEAISLLRRAHEIEPWSAATVLDLARLLAKTDQRDEALTLLETLAARCPGTDLARVCAVRWRIAPTLRNTWRWIKAMFGSHDEDPSKLAKRPRIAA